MGPPPPPPPPANYWIYIDEQTEREREGDRNKDGERERSFPWFTLAGWNATLRYQPYSFRTGFNALCQQYVFPTPLLLSLNLRYPSPW